MPAISFWTYVLNGASITIDETFNLKNISIELISGTGSFQGELVSGTIASSVVPLFVNKPVTLSTASINNISGLTIDATSGVVNIVAF
jgi:hypothetical protein